MNDSSKETRRYLLILSAFVLLVFFLSVPLAPSNPQASKLAAVAITMAFLWISNVIPLGVTALLPVFLFPILGIASAKTIAPVYMNSVIFLFIGGFSLAIAMEKWNLHRRVSLAIVNAIGYSPGRIIMGFMVAVWLVSMFISNTAATLMMLPIALAVVAGIEEKQGAENVRSFSSALMIGVAYAASIGGTATLVGTPPNLAFERIFQISFPNAPEIGFGTWMAAILPISVIMLFVAWFLLTKVSFKIPKGFEADKSAIVEERKALGSMSKEEKIVAVAFFAAALLWIFRTNLKLGFAEIPGWAGVLPYGKYIDDGAVAVFVMFALFLAPAKRENSSKILEVADIRKIPWDIILLFGGGFALAKGFQTTGLAEIIGRDFSGLKGDSPLIFVAAASVLLTFMTEITSNTATTQTLLPIFASIAAAAQINPLITMIPATISASFAFMLPVATPPNAIVFGSGRVKIGDMVKTGLILNIVGIIVVVLTFYFVSAPIFGVDFSVFPQWAK